MKKKLLPFILGCAVSAAMPFVANAATTVEYANEIPTSGQSPHSGDESQNGFTEYNDTAGSSQNTLAKTFTGSTTVSGSGLGNTKNSASNIQSISTITNMNEKQGYRSGSQATTLSADLAEAHSANPQDNDFNTQDNDTAGTTDLETSLDEFNMTIPASTVLPIGATHWRIGNVKIEGKYFVRPDKIKVVVTKQNFHHQAYDGNAVGGEAAEANTNKVIAFDVSDKRYDNTSIVGVNKYFFQDGEHAGANNTSTMQNTFPYSYTGYTCTDYQNGLVSDINETHQVWLVINSNAWSGKTAGKYTGSVTFNAEVVTDDNASMYQNTYPGEGLETSS